MMTRVGEYLLFHTGMGYDRSTNNFSVNFSVEANFGGIGTTNNPMSSLLGVR